MTTPHAHPRDPLHGITLETILKHLVQRHGWPEMARRIPIRCFMFDPSVTSSLKFLRKTPWARQKVETWFILEQPQRREAGPSATPAGSREPTAPPGVSPPPEGDLSE
ncbi:MAG: hypothetical protein RL514_4079 [Verrucomicrobiota bacterium]|jgi:uncharacterized protein (DUF2132 family)